MNAREIEITLRRSDELDRWQHRILSNWQAGYAAADAAHAGDYDEGFAAGIAAVKSIQHGAYRDAELESRRWELRGETRLRETFSEPHAGDFPGGSLPLERPGEVYLGGAPVHGPHGCTAACRSYSAGWYAPADALVILRRLPGDYADAIECLAAMSARGGEAA